MTVTGPDFIALQVRDLDRAAAFYETHLALYRTPVSPPHAVVFDTAPASFAVREPLPGVDLEAARPRPGIGVRLWLQAGDAEAFARLLDRCRRPHRGGALRRAVRTYVHLHRPRRVRDHGPRPGLTRSRADQRPDMWRKKR